jgi:hypothetical protein
MTTPTAPLKLTVDPSRQYAAAMDSVKLINALRAKASLTEKEQATIARNVEHLEIMLAKDYWTTEDLTPFQSAVTA